jgi:cell division protein FtsB
MGISDTVNTLNSAVRTLLATVVVAGVGFLSYLGYDIYSARDRATKELTDVKRALQEREAKISSLNREIKEKDAQIEKLETAMRLLKSDSRVALLGVIDMKTDEAGKVISTDIEFVEVDKEGRALDEPKRFTIMGDTVYIDSRVVKFADEYVERADLARGTSLVSFRGIFGRHQTPSDAFLLDKIDDVPAAYRRGKALTELEKKIWADFWAIANDPEKAKELGIRAAQGEAPSMKLERGKVYRIDLRSSDGLTIRPDPDAKLPSQGPSA